MVERQKHRAILLILLFLIPFAVYSGNLAGDFVYDDNVQVFKNPWITDPGFIPDILTSSSMSFSEGRQANTYRPTIYLLYMAEYQVFGLKPWGFHLVNNILHSINVLLVFLVAARLMAGGDERRGRGERTRPATGLRAPFLVALVFALHPINSEVVTWVAAVPELLYTMFLLISFYLYVKARDRGGVFKNPLCFASSIVCFFLALLSKETAMALIVLIPVYEFSMTGLAAVIGRGCRRMWSAWLVYFVAALVYMAIRTSAIGGLLQVKGFELTAYENVLNVFPLVARYLGKLILPVGLSAIYSFLPVHSLFEPMAIIGIISSLILVGLVVISRSRSTLFFGFFWIFIPLMPVLYMPAVSAGGFADRYLYLPSMGFAMVAVLFAESVLARYRGPSAGGALSALAVFLAGGTLLLYTAGSIKRSIVWRDDYSLWSDTVEKSPGSANAQYNLGWKLHKMGRLDEAVERYKTALGLNPNKDEAHSNLAIIYSAKGEKKSALKHYGEVLRIKPASPAVYYEMAIIYQSIGSGTEPIALYKEAIRLNPAYENAHYNLGWTYQSIGDYANAVAEYNEVIRLNRQSADAHYNLGLVYIRMKMWDKAAVHFKAVMDIAPGYPGARERLEELAVFKSQGGVRR